MKIKNKIICGYALVLGVAQLGTVSGLIVGNHYQQQALQARQNASQELKLLSDLQVQILSHRPAKQLSPYLSDPQAFRRESSQFLQQIEKLKQLLATRHTLKDHPQLAQLQSLLNQYEITLGVFYRQTKNFVQQVEPLTSSPVGKEKAEKLLLNFVKTPEYVAFIDFPEQLQPFYALANQREQAAELELSKAESLRNKIILIGLLLSVIIAVLLSFYTSKSIAIPIQKATKVAQKITQRYNFNLRVPIISNDEVGILADAINKLIQEVQKLLQENNQKNLELQQALETLNKQQIQLIQPEKMSVLQQLAAVIAHEINNPVNFIHANLPHIEESTQYLLNFLQIVQKHYPQQVEALAGEADTIEVEFLQEYLPKILTSIAVDTERIRQIVLSLKNLALMQEAELKAVDIHDAIDNTLMTLQHRIQPHLTPTKIQIIKEYSQLPLIECYAGELNQVFINIISNAIDAVETSHKNRNPQENKINPPQIKIRTTRLNEEWVEIAIADNGCGIPQDIQKLIFDPFFTTKPVGKGTGIGMSISHQIITEKHHGKLEFVSREGDGTEFLIQIPVIQKI